MPNKSKAPKSRPHFHLDFCTRRTEGAPNQCYAKIPKDCKTCQPLYFNWRDKNGRKKGEHETEKA